MRQNVGNEFTTNFPPPAACMKFIKSFSFEFKIGIFTIQFLKV